MFIKLMHDKSKSMKEKILNKSKELFGNVNTYIYYKPSYGWWIKIIVSKDDTIEYDVYIDQDTKEIEFEVKS